MNFISTMSPRVLSAFMAGALTVCSSPLLAGVGVGGVVEPVDDQTIEYVSGGKTYKWVISPKEYCVERKGRASKIEKIGPVQSVDLLHAFKELNAGVHSQTPNPAAIEKLLDQTGHPEPPKFHPVVYPLGKMGQKSARGVLRPMVNVIVANGMDLKGLQNDVGAVDARWVVPGRAAVLEFSSVEDAVASLRLLSAIEGVEKSYPEISGRLEKKAIPLDPLFSFTPPRVNYQWHLRNVGANGGLEGVDVNITDVWDTYTGSGIAIGIVDDGLQTFHPDLFQNVDFVNDWDFNGDDDDPNPLNDSLDGIEDTHGTSVAGVTGARWNNGIGGVGSAPECTLVGLRVLGDVFTVTEEDFAAAVGWEDGGVSGIDISNNSWGPSDPTGFVDNALVVAAMREGALTGRGGLGRIFCFAAGNDGGVEGNTNHSTLTTAPESVVVAALNDDGTRSFFSTPGAALTISAPSGGSENQQNVTTTTLTDVSGGYTDSFSGTSSATPLVSGCIALMLEANPGLGWRDVQEILIRTARMNDVLDPDWIENRIGLHFNHNYGAGMIDAKAAVEMASTWTNLTARQMVEVERTDFTLRFEPDPDDPEAPPIAVGTMIPDAGLPLDVLINAANFTEMRAEHAILNLDIEHPNRTELEVTLISPSGTSSLVLDNFIGSEENIAYDFPLSTVRNWGEEFPGVWRIRIRDTVAGGVGELLQAKLTVYGTTPDALPPRELPGLAGSRRLTFREGEFSVVPLVGTPTGSTVSITAGDLPDGLFFEPVQQVVFGTPSETGEYPVEITVTNGPDSRPFIVIFVVGEAAGSTLGEAIEQTTLSTSSYGSGGPWVVDVDRTYDGSDAAVSPADLGDFNDSELVNTASGSGVMVYAWLTSSEENRDRLWFYRNGEPERDWFAFVSGLRDWGRVAVPVVGGSQYRWQFARDAFGSLGTNQGWVDTVSVIPLVDFVASIQGVLGTTEKIYLTGKSYWLTEPSLVDGIVQDVVRSPSIGNGQHSGLSVIVEGPAHLKFNWKIDSAPLDNLYLLVNGSIALTIQGLVHWEEIEYEIPAGTHELEWRFSKDNSFSFGADAAFLKSLSVEQFLTFDTWIVQFLNADQADDPFYTSMVSDPDGDGWSSFEEYVYGGNPMVSEAGPLPNAPKLVNDSSGDLVYRFELPAIIEDVSIRIDESMDLIDWNPAPDTTVTLVGDMIRYEVPLIGAVDSKYLRVDAVPVLPVTP